MSRWPEHRISPSLARIGALCELLGDPQHAMPVIQIAGTNGKGTTAIVIESLLRSVGLRTGRYSSPHLESLTERIAIDGQPISEERFDEIWEQIEPMVQMVDQQQIDGIEMTFFEVMTGMAYAAFADAPVDVAIVEVGLGGGWDATSVAHADVAVITPIDFDHIHILGTDLAAIAGEKAGIIKPADGERPASAVVLAGQQQAAAEVLMRRCVEVGTAPVREGIDFGVLERRPGVGGQVLRLMTSDGPLGDLHLPLYGAHQAANAALGLAAVETFLGGRFHTGAAGLGADVVQAGLDEVQAPGRLEVIRTSPTIVLDAAHNPHGARAAAAGLTEAFEFDPLIGVIAVMKDKDAASILDVWADHLSRVVITRVAGTDRGMPPEQLAERARAVFGSDRVDVVEHLPAAIDHAVALADTSGGVIPGVLVTGSVVAVGQARHLLRTESEEG